MTSTALRHRLLFLLAAIVLLVPSAGIMPLVGRDLMPPMDTGIIKVNFETDANTSLDATSRTLAAMEWAIGLERLSPMAIVAIGGLMVSTFLTMVYVPILYSLLEDARTFLQHVRRRLTGHGPAAAVAGPVAQESDEPLAG